MFKSVFIAIGSNLADVEGRPPYATCEWALERLSGLRGLHLAARSRWYRSAPVPPSEQSDYVNGIVGLKGEIDPFFLLEQLHAIEAAAGRVRSVANAARTLDLDLIAMGGLVIDDPGLQLPHPRMAERAFVLAPLCEFAPGWVHPVLGRTAAELLAGCDMTGLSLLSLAGSSGTP